MARRSEHSLEELKTIVLDAAETIVVEEGFSALTARKIAMEIGYTVGSIYMVFANMADLILHINARTLDAIAARLEQVQNRSRSPDQSIETLAVTYLSYASQNFNRWRKLFEYPLLPEAEIPEWYREKVDDAFAPVEAQFAKLAPDFSEEHRKRAARALWCGVHGICMLSLSGKQGKSDINDIEEMVVLLVRSFMHCWVAYSDK